MKSKFSKLKQAQALRTAAEKEQLARTSPKTSTYSKEQLEVELDIHQIELELQNEELKRVFRDLQTSLRRYRNLYDLAPVGYLTLSSEGTIIEANHIVIQKSSVRPAHAYA